MAETINTITPFLWFNDNAEEAVDFYLTVFPNSRRTGGLPNGPNGKALTIAFELQGRQFIALNGGPLFKFNESISFTVLCQDQAEIDHYWTRLTADGGQESQCGWLKDRYGLSWQINPVHIFELVRHPNAFQAMLSMKKLIIADLEAAARQL